MSKEHVLIIASGDHHKCCCTHGSRCGCSLKKEHHLDTVPEDISPAILAAAIHREPVRSRLSSQLPQESKLTVFTNGHHKPVHKVNDIHNKCGAPYKIPSRAHTIHGHKEVAQRSSDSLPMTKVGLVSGEVAQNHDSIASTPQPLRRVKSEHASPVLEATSWPLVDQESGSIIPPLDAAAYSYSPFGSGSPSLPSGTQQDYHFPDKFPDNYFVSYEMASKMGNQKQNEWEPPLHSRGLGEVTSEVDWSTFNFPSGDGAFSGSKNGAIPSQPPSFNSVDHFSYLSHPGLTSSSGEISEVEDIVPFSSQAGMPNSAHDTLDDYSSAGGQETPELEQYRLSSASSYIGMPQAAMLANGNLESLDINEYLRRADAQTREMALQCQEQQQQTATIESCQASGFRTESADSVEHPYSIQEAQKYAHMTGPSAEQLQDQPSLLVTTTANDPMWSCQPPRTPNGMLDEDEEDDGWVG